MVVAAIDSSKDTSSVIAQHSKSQVSIRRPLEFGASPARVAAEDAIRVAEGARNMIAKVTSHRFPPGEAWRYGLVPQIACIINGVEGTATFDTGAQPSVISAAVLARHDPVFKTKLLQADLPSLSGYGGRVKVIGVYPCEIIFPHPGKEGNVALDMEFLVTTEKRVPYDILIGCEWQTIYGVSINRNPMHSSCPYISFGKHQQRFAIGTFKDANVAAMEIVPPKRVDERFPSGYENVNYDEFMQILAKPMHASAVFLEHLEEVDINPALSNEQRQQLLKVIAACEHAFVGKDDVVTYGELGAPVHLDVNIPQPIPKACRKAPYPLSNQAKMDIREIVDDLLRKGIVSRSKSPVSAPAIMVYRGSKKQWCKITEQSTSTSERQRTRCHICSHRSNRLDAQNIIRVLTSKTVSTI